MYTQAQIDNYQELQRKHQKLLTELQRENPSLFDRLLKAGFFGVFGIGMGLLFGQDPVGTGALAVASTTIRNDPSGNMGIRGLFDKG